MCAHLQGLEREEKETGTPTVVIPKINTAQILRTSPHIGVIVLTTVEDDAAVFAAMRAGARGYLSKGALGAKMLRAIGAVGDGEVTVGDERWPFADDS